MVLANPEIAKLPNWVIALVAAGGLAAALSTAAGLLLAISLMSRWAALKVKDIFTSIFVPFLSAVQENQGGWRVYRDAARLAQASGQRRASSRSRGALRAPKRQGVGCDG